MREIYLLPFFIVMQTSLGSVRTAILDGWRLSERIRDQIFYKTSRLFNDKQLRPGLAVIRVGNQMEMERYVYAKRQLAFSLGINFSEHSFPGTVKTEDIQECIHMLNKKRDVNGIIVQLPLPQTIDSLSVLNTVHPSKDVDCCHSFNQGKLFATQQTNISPIPCAAMAAYRIPMEGKQALIIGRSTLVGIPCFSVLQQMGATCTVAHEHSRNTQDLCRSADIVVSAVGNPGMIKGSWLKPGSTVIDIGTRCVKDKQGNFVLAGDVDLGSCIGTAGSITPVPGGVALLTTAMLMSNTLKACIMQNNLNEYFNSFSDSLCM